jgi:hypothetical protein
MKKLNICIAGIAALLCTSCSDSDSVKDLAGTSEEMNELAENDSSSSTKETKNSSSSEKDNLSSSSEETITSSSSEEQGNIPQQESSLDNYLKLYDLQNKVHFDRAVMAFSASEMVSRAPGIDGGAGATEFDGEGVRKFVKQNIAALESFFPKAAEKYADLIEATKNGTNECTLYMFNLYGNEKYAGHVLEYISPDTMKVVNIEAKNCEASTDNQIVRFLFSYCGDVDRDPTIVRSTAKSSIAKDECPATKTDEEWVSIISSNEINSSASKNEPNSSSSNGENKTCRHISDNVATEDGTNCNSVTDTNIVIDCVSGERMKCEANYWVQDVCDPGSDCDGDGFPDGIYRPDLEPCDTDTLLEFFGNHYQCVENKWVLLPAPDNNRSQARNVSVQPRQGMALAPRVVMARNSDGTITIRDDGFYVSNSFIIKDVYTEISGDTIIVEVVYPEEAQLGSSQISAITFTVSKEYTNVKYLKYKNSDREMEIQEVDELPPCASSSTCQECGEGLTC